MGFFSWGNSPQVVLALDIGTEVVKVLVVRVEPKEGRGVVIGVGKVSQQPGNMRSGAVADIHGVIELSRQAYPHGDYQCESQKDRQEHYWDCWRTGERNHDHGAL